MCCVLYCVCSMKGERKGKEKGSHALSLGVFFFVWFFVLFVCDCCLHVVLAISLFDALALVLAECLALDTAKAANIAVEDKVDDDAGPGLV